MYCDHCHKGFTLAQTAWTKDGLRYHADCLPAVILKLRHKGKFREADELRYGVQPEKGTDHV